MSELASALGLSVVRLARVLRQQYEGDLTQTLYSALATISRSGPLTLGELASAEHVAPATVTKLVASLIEQGLVTRSTGPDDRRVVRVLATDKGRGLLDENRRRRSSWLAERLGELSDEERHAIAGAVEILDRMVQVPRK